LSRNIEVLIKKAAVDPAFKKALLEKRAGAADDVALALEPAEAAILDAVPADQLKAIIGRTKVSPRLRPVLLGATATAMLAALGTAASGCKGEGNERAAETGTPEISREVPEPANPEEIPAGEIADDVGAITGVVIGTSGGPGSDVWVNIAGTDFYARPGKDGGFRFRNLRPGTYELYAFRPSDDFTLATLPGVQVRAGERTAVTIEVEASNPHPKPIIPLSVGIQPDKPSEGTGE
jgi:hypothetical protein